MEQQEYFTIKQISWSHMSIREGGLLKYIGKINCTTHVLHGSEILKQIFTPRNKKGEYGKPETIYQIIGQELRFESIHDLINHYNLPSIKQEKTTSNE